jgi:hypothetical protein
MTSEMVHFDLGNGVAVFKSEVSIPGGGSAIGYGSETAKDFGDYLEKAQTKSLGRALAALGYGTQFCLDFEERLEGNNPRIADAPIERPKPVAPVAQAPRTAAQEEASMLIGTKWLEGLQFLITKAGWSEEAVVDALKPYGIDKVSKLNLNSARLLRKTLEDAIKAKE